MPEKARMNEMRAGMRVLVFVMLILGCGGHERMVLLPDREGATGAVSVKTAKGEILLTQPYQAADVDADGRIEPKTLDPKEVQKQFGPALSAQPPRPVSYTLYFVSGKEELTPESKPVMEQIKTELSNRPFAQITVIGHTDRVGSVSYNDALSLKRAEAMRQILVQAGIPLEQITVAGRGAREMLVPTEEKVAEPRNRRVEISVR
jgi:outer membrane protein OmpA-like peptidoglycan-associated protein